MTRPSTCLGAIVALGLTLALSPSFSHAAVRDNKGGPPFYSTEDFQVAQSILVHSGYLRQGSYASGLLDQPTINAIRAFQREHAIRPSGMLDPETMGMLMSHKLVAAAPSAPPPARGQMELSEKVAAEEGVKLAARETVSKARVAHADPDATHRSMPRTGGPIALLVVLGGALMAFGVGLAVLARRF